MPFDRHSYRKLFDLSGKVALVTGGAGILGRQFCAALADHGAQVAVADVDENAATELADELAGAFGIHAVGIGVDITDEKAVLDMIASAEARLGPISVLHNNAATKSKDLAAFFEPVSTFSMETWREVMAVNLDAMFLVARYVGERMATRGGGSIIQTSSIYGIAAPDQRIYEGSEYLGRPINTPAVYSASKAGVVGLTNYLATYWGAQGVRVNTITPGGVESGQNDTFSRRYSQRVPLNRMAEGREMAGALVFLASDASSYMTGQNLVIDGGLTAW